MFSARAYSFRQKSRLAISLSWVAGYANVVVFAVCGIVVSHVTGTTTLLGKAISERAGIDVVLLGLLWLSFLLGAAGSAVMTESARRAGSASKYVLPLALEALLLTLVAVAINRNWPIESSEVWVRHGIGYLAAFAMGLQNATITRISGAVVRTTHLTGVTTDLGLEGVQYLLWLRDRVRGHGWPRAARVVRVSARHPELQRVLLLASIWGSFLLGAVVGTAVLLSARRFALVPPISFLLWCVYVDYRKPIADVREIDLLQDRELRLLGIVRSLLPAEVGIWRVFCKHNGRWHAAPDFEQWVDIMPHHWRVVILSFSPLTRLDANALLNLEAATRKLLARGRRLVLAGLTPTQYHAIARAAAGELIGGENLCPDLEFAVARGIDLVERGDARGTLAAGGMERR